VNKRRKNKRKGGEEGKKRLKRGRKKKKSVDILFSAFLPSSPSARTYNIPFHK
jgi:hypothetical protein